ncbi:serine/threonine-protein kinase [Streptosporangium sp. 'caverna']|uniref:serine/threonine-protein kinase n=1 Tax=Streptosporangium sp. 'caverna' TaxID=2202249 RepID=UPI000D7E2E3C|nr:serine/threonine-protein kinase [Streptosporangium sp. 'caverna']AWS46472.1 serine/threonine protein kinase [Streptosporangium sp. 'caverna']
MVAPDGERLGPYRLLSKLGAGGFGEVHLALDPEGRTVAVKILHPQVAADATALTRLAREVETMRRVQGPHIAEVLDASMEGDRPYLVTRYVQGRPLSAMVAGDGPIGDDDLVRLACGLAEALTAIHATGVVHRDLKPANVILTDGEPVVIDFGIACALDSPSVTTAGAILGTPGYLAPEVLEGADSGAEADIFSFGATLAYAATGRHPYGPGPASAVGYRVVHHPPDLEGVPGWLEPLLRECLLRDPAARPSASMLLVRLSAAPVVQAVVSSGPSAPRTRSAFATAAFQDVAGFEGAPAAGRRDAQAGDARGRGAHVRDAHVQDARVQDAALQAEAAGMHDLTTRQWRPGRRPQPGRPSPEEARERRRAVVHRRWVVGTGLLVSLMAAAAKGPLPEVSLLLLTGYGLVMLTDGGIALFARRNRPRMIIDLASAAGTVGLWVVLGTFFSTLTLALALGTVVFVLVAILVGS